MSEVIERKLSDIGCEFISGFGFKSSDYINTGIPLIKIGNIQNRIVSVDINGTYIPENIVNDKIKQVFLSNNDVLIAMTGQGSVGRVGRLKLRNNDKALLNQRVGKFVCDEKNINVDYLYYILTSDKYQDYLFNTGAGSGQPNLSPDLILQTEIPWCEYTEQKAIAEVLSSLDDKIDLLHRQNKTLEQMAETLFRQWFVEEAGEDWGEGVLGDVIEIYDSKRVPLSKMQRNKMKEGILYPYYGAATIMDYVNDYIFDGDYILLGEDGTVRTNEGYPVLQYATGKFWVNNHTHIFKAKTPYNNFFIWNFLSKKNIDRIITGAVQPKINQTNLKSLEFPNFPEDLVNEYIKITDSQFIKINKNKKQIRTLQSLRDTLLPKLMSGEIRDGCEVKTGGIFSANRPCPSKPSNISSLESSPM
jgi:type I restriction enzyme S subunit